MAINYLDMEDRKDVYTYFHNKNDVGNNQIFLVNNWCSYNNKYNKNLAMIADNGGAIWLNSKGDLCYTLTYYDNDILTSTAKKISLLFNNIFKTDIVIREKYKEVPISKKPMGINSLTDQILIEDIPFVKGECFTPLISSEFYRGTDGFIYRNTFKPTPYFLMQPTPEKTEKYSIILQYIYHLADYKEDRFKYIMNWLAGYFKNLVYKSDVTLVLIGKKKSATNILFDEIIKPLFGQDYSVKVNDAKLQTSSLASILENQLFYNFDDITSLTTESKKTNTLLEEIFNTDSHSKLQNYGQILITISEPYIPYIDSNYNKKTVFKVPKDIDDIYIPKIIFPKDTDISKFTTDDLINFIRSDLENFSLILKSYKVDFTQSNNPFDDDDKDSLIENLEDKLKAFSKAVIEADRDCFIIIKDINPSLYKEIMEDFENDKIKQRNLLKCFTIIHKEEKTLHSRTLMVKLRAVSDNHGFFETDALEAGAGGVKYFNIRIGKVKKLQSSAWL